MVERYFDPVTGRIKLLNWVEVRRPRDNGRRPTGRDVKQARGASPPEWAVGIARTQSAIK